jgi:hypothetical protein
VGLVVVLVAQQAGLLLAVHTQELAVELVVMAMAQVAVVQVDMQVLVALEVISQEMDQQVQAVVVVAVHQEHYLLVKQLVLAVV